MLETFHGWPSGDEYLRRNKTQNMPKQGRDEIDYVRSQETFNEDQKLFDFVESRGVVVAASAKAQPT